MSLLLRSAVPEDEPFLYTLAYENFYDQLAAWAWQPHLREPLLKMQIQGQRSAYAAQYPNAVHGIIVLDDRDVGQLIVDRTEDMHFLVDITVQRQSRGKGIGTWILRALCVEAEMLRKPLRLQVMINNRAKDLYHRLGFHMIEDRQVAWLMERRLDS